VGKYCFWESAVCFFSSIIIPPTIQYKQSKKKRIDPISWFLIQMARLTPNWTQPSHPHVLEVIDLPGDFASLTRSLVELPPGALLARISMPPLTFTKKAYSTVQVSRHQHVELNCDFLFTNHSCEPSVEFHVQKTGPTFAIDVRVAARQDADGRVIGLRKGDDLTFFYPSTEWDMAQPFACNCGTATCLKWIDGAGKMGMAKLQGKFLSSHIKELLHEQMQLNGDGSGTNGAAWMPDLNGSGKNHFVEHNGSHDALAKAVGGEIGGDNNHFEEHNGNHDALAKAVGGEEIGDDKNHFEERNGNHDTLAGALGEEAGGDKIQFGAHNGKHDTSAPAVGGENGGDQIHFEEHNGGHDTSARAAGGGIGGDKGHFQEQNGGHDALARALDEEIGGNKNHFGEHNGRHAASARALGGEMGGDTTL
jgi:hypothetical protein